MRQRGYSAQYCQTLFEQLRSFSLYGFPESHAASFALLVYVSAYLKHHYPAAFTAALLNSQPMGFYAPAQLIRSARLHRVSVRPADVNHSEWDCTLETDKGGGAALRLGLRSIAGLSPEVGGTIVAARTEPGKRPRYTSIEDFVARTGLGRAKLILLSCADAFLSLKIDRRTALWNALAQESSQRVYPLFGQTECNDDLCSELPTISEAEQVLADYQAQGLSLRGHPISFFRTALSSRGILCLDRLGDHPHDRRAEVAGLVLGRQRPATAGGITFITIEDESGIGNLILHANTTNRFRKIANSAAALIARGRVERNDGVTHLIVDRLQVLGADLGANLDTDVATDVGADLSNNLGTRSRDYR